MQADPALVFSSAATALQAVAKAGYTTNRFDRVDTLRGGSVLAGDFVDPYGRPLTELRISFRCGPQTFTVQGDTYTYELGLDGVIKLRAENRPGAPQPPPPYSGGEEHVLDLLDDGTYGVRGGQG